MKDLNGTVYYLAPEMFIKNKKFDKLIESWSLGVILHEMAIGCRPFKGSTHDIIAKKIFKADIDFDKSKYKEKSIELLDLIDQLLTKNPKLRLSIFEIKRHAFLNEESKPV